MQSAGSDDLCVRLIYVFDASAVVSAALNPDGVPRREGHPMLNGAATVFVVRDIASSLGHYRDVLGFEVTFQYGEPTFYVCLCRDEVGLHLLADRRTGRLPGHGGIAIFVSDVDALHAELSTRGAQIARPPQDYAYGMRDFNVIDPDGNQLTFGMAVAT